MFHGEGIYYIASQNQYYIGSLTYSLCHGSGSFVWLRTSDVWKNNIDPTPGALFSGLPFDFQGESVQDQKHGKATLTFKDGRKLQTMWNYGELVSTVPSTISNEVSEEALCNKRKRKGPSHDKTSPGKRNRKTSYDSLSVATDSFAANIVSGRKSSLIAQTEIAARDPATTNKLALRLRELNDLYENKLISKHVYDLARDKLYR